MNFSRIFARCTTLGLALFLAAPLSEAQIPIGPDQVRDAFHGVIPKLKPSAAWDDPAAVERGQKMIARLIAAGGGMEKFRQLSGVRYDTLLTSRSRTINKVNNEKWRVHHYEPRLTHLDTRGHGFLLSEFAKPTLRGPDFSREVLFEGIAWREMRGNYYRTEKARRTAKSAVRLEYLTGLMPFSLDVMQAELAYEGDEVDEASDYQAEIYAMRLAEPLVMNVYPMIVKKYETITEFKVFIDPRTDMVMQIKYAFPDKHVRKKPHMRWVTIEFSEWTEIPGRELKIPYKRLRYLAEWSTLEEWWVEDIVVEELPAASVRRPWQAGEVYRSPIWADFWDPPSGLPGVEGVGLLTEEAQRRAAEGKNEEGVSGGN